MNFIVFLLRFSLLVSFQQRPIMNDQINQGHVKAQLSSFIESEKIVIFHYVTFFSEPILVQTCNYVETSPLIFTVK